VPPTSTGAPGSGGRPQRSRILAGWDSPRRGLGPANAERLDLSQIAPRALALTRSTPAPAWPKSSASTSKRSGSAPARVCYASTAKEASRAGSSSTWSCARRTRPGSKRAPTGPAPTWRCSQPRGGRLTARGASDIFTAIVAHAALDDEASAHVLRHTLRHHTRPRGTDLVTVAEGSATPASTKLAGSPCPPTEDRRTALDPLPTER
jgi:hypothetical protein